MYKLTQADADFSRRCIASGKATDEESAFLDTMCGLQAANEPVSRAEYNKLQRLTGRALCLETPILNRA